MLVINPLGKEDVEFDDKVTTGAIRCYLKLCSCVSNNISSEGARHAFAGHSKFRSRADNLIRSAKDFPIIKGINSNRLHFE